MAEPRGWDDFVHHRYAIEPSPEEDALLAESGVNGFRHQRDLLKARLVTRVRRGRPDLVDDLPVRDSGWWLSLLGEAAWECRSRGAWGGAPALAPLTEARDRLASLAHRESSASWRTDAAPPVRRMRRWSVGRSMESAAAGS